MSANITSLLQKVSNDERSIGLMTVFSALSREEQVALLEWSRSICIKLASFMERQSLDSVRADSIDLPAPKPYVELALKVGAIRALTTGNEDLLTACTKAFKQVLGEARLKHFDEFQETVKLSIHIAKW